MKTASLSSHRTTLMHLSKKSIKVTDKVWKAAMAHNALSNDDVEELTKE